MSRRRLPAARAAGISPRYLIDGADAPAALRAARIRGFTLLELLIAVALMAVLAVLGWRGLDSVLRGREYVTQTSDALRAVSVAFTQLDDDLRRSWPVRLLGAGLAPIGFAGEEPGAPPAMQLLRELPPDSGAAQLQRVVWRVRAGVLERGFGAYALPSSEGAVSLPPLSWQPLMSGVTGWEVRAWIPGRGWLPASGLVPAAGVAPETGAITGVEVTLDQAGGERIVRVFSVRD